MKTARSFSPADWQPEIDIVRYRLDNGLTLFVLPDPRVPVVSLQVHYGVGSRNERPGITGISHLFEHMMFRGTKELGPEEFSRVLQAKGGEVNAFTTRDNTSYFENLPSEHLELGIKLEADRLLNLLLNEENFQTEREVVRSERKLRAVDSPFGLALELLFASAYTQHPYNWPVLGWDQDLQRLTLQDCLDYYQAYYHPGNMTIVIAGDAPPEAALGLVDRYFGKIPSPGAPPPLKVSEPPQRGERRSIFKKVGQVEALFAGFHVVDLGHPDIFPLTLLGLVLGGGKSSRFYQKFVRPGRAIELDLEMAPPPWSGQDPDLMLVTAVAAPGQPLKDLELALWEELEEVKTKGVTPEELSLAQKLLKAQIVQSLAKSFYRGLLVGLLHLKTGEAEKVNRLLELYEAVTPDDLARAARQYLSPDNRTVVIQQPVSQEESRKLGEMS